MVVLYLNLWICNKIHGYENSLQGFHPVIQLQGYYTIYINIALFNKMHKNQYYAF